MNSEPTFVEVYRARNIPEAHAIRLALEEAGIPMHIDGESLLGFMGEQPAGWDTVPRILVDVSHVGEAQRLIALVDERRPNPPRGARPKDAARCLACGLPMTETEVRCEGCGWSFEDDENAEPGSEPNQS